MDYDLDGRLDLLQVNGHLETEIARIQSSQHYAQPPLLFWNCGPDCPATFVAVSRATGDLGRPLVGRGATYADIDGDGDLDLLITQNGRAPVLLRNDQALGHHWLRLRLRSPGRQPRRHRGPGRGPRRGTDPDPGGDADPQLPVPGRAAPDLRPGERRTGSMGSASAGQTGHARSWGPLSVDRLIEIVEGEGSGG